MKTLAFTGLLLAGLQEEDPVALVCKPPAAGTKAPVLRLEGTAPFADEVVLKLSVHRLFEVSAGARLEPMAKDQGPGLVKVKGKKFRLDHPVEARGGYLVLVDLLDEFQRPDVAKALRGKVKTRRWEFRFAAWGDELAGQLGPKLEDLDRLTAEAQELIGRVEKAAVSKASWEAEAKRFQREVDTFLRNASRMDLENTFPAAYDLVRRTVHEIQSNSPYFLWENGKFAGAKDYHEQENKAKTFQDEEFNFAALKRYLEQSRPVGGREFALWVVKELRRTNGTMARDLADALKKHADHAGLAPFAERLEKATAADLTDLEAEIRGAKEQAPPPANAER
jgi:hypothetical protein